MSGNIVIVHDKIDQLLSLDEQETLEQVEQIKATLLLLGYEVISIGFDGDLLGLESFFMEERPLLVFNLVETYYKSRFLHIIPLLCEKLKIKCSGGNANSLYLSGDKAFAKQIMNIANIPTPPYLTKGTIQELQYFVNKKMIMKKRDEEASIGLTDDSVFTPLSVESLKHTFLYSQENNFLVEEYVEGREVNVSVMQNRNSFLIFPIAEMIFTNYPADKPKIVSYEAKWDTTSFAYKNSNRSFEFEEKNPVLTKKIKNIVKKCWSCFDCSGYNRFDFRIDEHHNVYLLELNVNPSLSQQSGFIAAANQAGLSYQQVIKNIVEQALWKN